MKKKHICKKVYLGVLTACLFLGIGLIGGCKQASNPVNIEGEQSVLRLNKTSVQLSTYQTFLLKVNVSSGSVKWSSANESVATVENGLVTACGVGETLISVKVGDEEASCLVNIVKNPLAPVIKTDLNYENNIFLDCEYLLNFDTILFDGKEYAAEFSYESSDPSIITVSNEGVVKARSEGTAFITATTKWRGNDVIASYKYTVIDNKAVINVENSNIVLYSAEIDNFSNKGEIVATLVKDGKIVGGTLHFESADEQIVQVTDSGALYAHNAGETIISIIGESNDTVFPQQTVKVKVEVPIVQRDSVVKLCKTENQLSLTAKTIFADDDLDISKVVRKDIQSEINYTNGKIDVTDLQYGYYDFIYYTANGKYGVELKTYIAPPIGTLLLSENAYGVEQITSGSGLRLFDSTVAWNNESGSMRLVNGRSSWISKIAFKVDDIENYECVYFRIFAGDEEGGTLFGFGNKTTSKTLKYGWNTIIIKANEMEGWYKSATQEITMGYTNGPQNNVEGNLIDDAWVSNIYGVSKTALEVLIASLDETLTEKDAPRVDVIVDYFSFISNKEVSGKESFIEKLKKFDNNGSSITNSVLVAADTRLGILQLTTNAVLSRDESFVYGSEKSTLKLYNANVSWITSFSFKVDNIQSYQKISFNIYVENEYGGLIYDKNKNSGTTIELQKGWNEIVITREAFSRYYNDETKAFTMHYTSFNADHSNQSSYWKSIWLSNIQGET